MSDAMLNVAGVGLWLPGVPEVGTWEAGARGVRDGAEYEPPSAAHLERRSRRRASALTKACSCAFAGAATQAGIDIETTGSVFGSALGEVSTMLGVLDQMARHEPLSPMHFATSVHSSAAGAVSISGKNRGFTTSISANYDTPASALFEAHGVVATLKVPVVIVCADDTAPPRFVEDDDSYDLAAIAIAVTPEASGAIARVSLPVRGAEPTLPIADVPPRLARNPQAGLLDLVASILAGRAGVQRLDRGKGGGFSVRVTKG